jgi:hypothetical protein
MGMASLDPRWAGGRPRQISPDDQQFIVETANSRPESLGVRSPGGARKLADYLSSQATRPIETGRERLRQILHRHRITFQRTKTWPQFGPLRTFVIAGSNHPNHPALTGHLHRYLRWRNANARHPDLLAAHRRERAASAANDNDAGVNPPPEQPDPNTSNVRGHGTSNPAQRRCDRGVRRLSSSSSSSRTASARPAMLAAATTPIAAAASGSPEAAVPPCSPEA